MRNLWMSFSLAWNFLTILPWPWGTQAHVSTSQLAQSMRWYPFVGFLLGGMLAVSDSILLSAFSESVANMMVIVILVCITGALHQDGLADTIDALVGGKEKTQRLTILRDSHIGAIGATGLMLALGLRYAGLVSLPSGSREWVLLCFPALGRWAMVIGTWKVFYARPDGGVAAAFIEYLSIRDVIVATLILAAGMFWSLDPLRAIFLLLSIVVVVRIIVWGATRLFGGMTGDILGTINEIVEIGFLLSAPFLVRNV
ncbi:MAG: adenosylcobinamide-GDP ribazoletransferase [Nitrospirales bacterium]|nr:adenosylcobinamide-GDP ribazoletransferase [Nitrospira sp.]MDR4502243.1 adenosylcobinamide-GDP ribazoletransferase [Nitrospirales bacterium]